MSGERGPRPVPALPSPDSLPLAVTGTALTGVCSPGEHSEQDVELSTGAMVHQYELIRELGRGGMGQVFLARDTKLARKVAIKFLHGPAAEQTEELVVEARATARCRHENIVVIHEVDEYFGTPFMVLEYLEGQSLGALLEQQALRPTRAIDIATQVAAALVKAHEFGIHHRDLKPDNIFVTSDGVVKVLDFGIAAVVAESDGLALTEDEMISGTPAYMAPERLLGQPADHRADIYAMGLILWEMLAQTQPLEGFSIARLGAFHLTESIPPIGRTVPDVPEELARIADTCLRKNPDERYGSASGLWTELCAIAPGRLGRALSGDENPYPGLIPFEESDADRFFGRDKETAQAVARLRQSALLTVMGPSGVGKSSFVRAGVLPALRRSGLSEAVVVRPGRSPLRSLSASLASRIGVPIEDLRAEWREAPGAFGVQLRNLAGRAGGQVCLVVDQAEELFTQTDNAIERHAFIRCVLGAADDPSSPVRVIVSMRSDFLDEAAAHPEYLSALLSGALFLRAPDLESLKQALTAPTRLSGYRFESDDLVVSIATALERSPNALPLLQFCAQRLWDHRDRTTQVISRSSYRAIGGVEGSLATHADDVVAALTRSGREIAKACFVRLVTPDRTRDSAELEELYQLALSRTEARSVVNRLVEARLLVVQTRPDEEPRAEIVHESLIEHWPTLRRWLDGSSEDAALLAQLRAAAKQWDQRERDSGLVWRGDAADDLHRLWKRNTGALPERDQAFVEATLAQRLAAGRRRRRIVAATIAVLAALLVAGAVALVVIRSAQIEAEQAKAKLQGEVDLLREKDAAEAQAAEAKKAKTEAESARTTAETERDRALAAATTEQQQRRRTYTELEDALAKAERERKRALNAEQTARSESQRARAAADSEKKAREEAERLLRKEAARVKELQRERERITQDLK